MKKTVIILLALTATIPCILSSAAQSATDKADFNYTVFTNPGENCSTAMNVSWVSPVGQKTAVMLSRGTDTVFLTPGQSEVCVTFDSIFSKLRDNTDVYERHVFNKNRLELTNLSPDTEYSYSIVSYGDGAVTEKLTDDYSFRTAGPQAWKAAVIGDFHHYSPLWRRLDASMAMIDVLDSVSGGFDWVLSTGDQCAWGGSFNYWSELSEQAPYRDYMWASVQGNHDHMTRENDKSDAFFRDSHANPMNGYGGQEGVSYFFKYGDVLFIMLNNEAMRTPESLQPVFDWMEKVIASNPSKYVVVVQHYEWLIGTNGANSQLDRFRDVFDRLGVDLAISGNNHAYLRTPPLRDRKPVAAGQGTFYVVCPSSDDSRGRDLKPVEDNEDIISMRWSEGPHTVGAMLMDVDSSRIVMTLYDRSGHIQDTFCVPAR